MAAFRERTTGKSSLSTYRITGTFVLREKNCSAGPIVKTTRCDAWRGAAPT